MLDFHKLIAEYQNCPCGQAHECAIDDMTSDTVKGIFTGEITDWSAVA